MSEPVNLRDLLADKSVAVVCGSGGVGKTTVGAALGLMAATEAQRNVLVLTIDPARRLADVLGMKVEGNEITSVDLTEAKGQLFASMLDTKAAWDELVRRHAPDADIARRILNNPLYGEITGRFVQSHDYIAMETLHQLHGTGEYDLLIIDTPPATQAVDFLDAPTRMASFFDSKLLKFLVAPSRSAFFSVTSRAFLNVANRLLGKTFLEDITELFTLLETMRPGFIARANEVDALLRAEGTTFVAVTTPEPAPSRSIARFIDELRHRHMHLGAVVLNRVLPAELGDPEAQRASDHLRRSAADLAADSENPVATERVFHNMSANFDRFSSLVTAEKALHVDLAASGAVRASAPLFGEEPNDSSALRRLGESIWLS